MGQAFAFELVGTVQVQALAADPSDAEWDAMLQHLATHRLADGTWPPIVVSSDGGAPNAAQRARLTKLLDRQPQRTAILTESALVRGALTAMRWFKADLDAAAFAPGDLEAALAYLRIPKPEHGGIAAALDRLRREVGLQPLAR